MGGLVVAPRVGLGPPAQPGDPVGPEPVEVLLLGGGSEHPLLDPARRSRPRGWPPGPRTRTRGPRRRGRPGVSRANRPPGWAPSGVSATASTRWAGTWTRWDHGRMSSTTRSTVATTPRRAASAPHTPSSPGGWKARLPWRSADRGVEQGDVGRVGLEQADLAERGVDPGVARVVGHRRAGQRGGGDGGQPAGRRLEALEEGQERPVLDLDLAVRGRRRRSHGLGEKFGKTSPE